MSKVSAVAANPKTREQCIYAINQSFWLLLLLSAKKIFTAGILVYVSFQTGVDTIGQISNSGATSLTGLSGLLVFDFVIIIIALIALKWGHSLIAALILLAIGILQLYSFVDAYYISQITPPRMIKLVLAGGFVLVSIWALLATFRLRALPPE